MSILTKSKNLLKKMLPNKVIQRLRLGSSNIYYARLIKKIERENKDNYVYIFGTAIHTNLGDHLITMAEVKFLRDILTDAEIIEIPTEVYQIYKQKLVKILNKKNLIIINGGGWMGNLWIKEELLIQDMVSSFKDNRIIIFPQTVYFDNNIRPYNDLIHSAKEKFGLCTKLLLTVRDQNSYDFVQKNYPKVKSILVPDITLYYNNYWEQNIKEQREDIVKFCIRDDREILGDDESKRKINIILEKYKIQIGTISTMFKTRVSESKRKTVVLERLKEFSRCKLIITDRLHGMIFSYLVGTPCIILDNKTKKVSGVYEKWLKDNDNIFPIYKNKNFDKIKKFIDNAINRTHHNKEEIDFSKLKKEITNG